MEVVVVPDPPAAGLLVADEVERLVTEVPTCVLGLATGSSPLSTYAELIRRHRAGRVSFAEVSAFLLDEYVGLPPDHPQSYRNVIRRDFTDHIDLLPEMTHGPDGHAEDTERACAEYEQSLQTAGGVDLQLLGIGIDGHLGFNEPTSSLGSRTRVKTLTQQTRSDNARFFESIEQVPRHVITQGIATILDARHLVLIATGSPKATPVARAVEGPLTAMVPASALQLHPHVTVVVDEAAAAELTLIDYYREAHAHKPPWQAL